MVLWFQRRPRATPPRGIQRRRNLRTTRVDFAELTPDVERYLGQVAYLQLGFYTALTRLVAECDSLSAKESLAQGAGIALAKHQGVVAEITRKNLRADELMAPSAAGVDTFFELTRGGSFNETLVSVYICQGFLDDFFVSLAAGLPSDVGPRIAVLLGEQAGEPAIVDMLTTAISEEPRRAHLLALWGRRLVGDTLLFARAALMDELSITAQQFSSEDERIEPVFTELIATHTRRMDALGLTA